MPVALSKLLSGLVTLSLVSCSSRDQETSPIAEGIGGPVSGSGATSTHNGSGGASGALRSDTRKATSTSGGMIGSERTSATLRTSGGMATETANDTTVGGAKASGGSEATSGGASGSTNRATTGVTVTGGTANGGATRGGAANGGDSGGVGGTTIAVTTAPCTSAASLKEAGQCSGRLVGAALSTKHLGEAEYASNALEFDYVTAEDEMKWDATEPTRNQFSFTKGDQILDFATRNGMKVKGHTLVWYNQLPSWVSGISDATELRSVMVNHIQGVMLHYKGKVAAWDVVNEAWDDTDPTKLRDSVFSRILGKTYIDDAFTAARAADPSAKLFYNDYATDGLGAKANSVYEMVKDLKARNIPIDGVGMQMHWRVMGSTLTAAEFASNMQRLVDLGVEVVISEMDVQLCKGGTFEEQSARFHDMVAACVAQPKCTAVTFWGITDKYSWLNARTDLGCAAGVTPRPLLWDDNYNKKPAYSGVMAALLGTSLE